MASMTIMARSLHVLGLPPYCSDLEVIKHAYSRLVLEHHPDKGGNSTKFIETLEAYRHLAGVMQSHKRKICDYDVPENRVKQTLERTRREIALQRERLNKEATSVEEAVLDATLNANRVDAKANGEWIAEGFFVVSGE
jgi:DnaJ-class molecular chaperone